MREGRVIRLLSEDMVVIDLGQVDGVQADMQFGIFTKVNQITDPESGEQLGSLELRKGTVVVLTIYPRFTLAGPPSRLERARIDLPGQPRRVAGKLAVRSGELEPLEGAGPVAVGDRVKLDSKSN